MAKFTIELTELVPNYGHVTVDAETLDEAIALAKDTDCDNWELDWQCSRGADVTGAWEGEEAYNGKVLLKFER